MPNIHEENLEGRVAIVTGSGQNIGAAIARRLVEAGAAVVVNGHASKDKVERTVSDIRAAGGRAHGIMADVSDPKDVGRLAVEANAVFGPVDIAISNVGRRLHKPFETMTSMRPCSKARLSRSRDGYAMGWRRLVANQF